MIKLDYNKYKAALSYILAKLGEIEGKKKACKIFYFLDFDFFEAYDKPFTGETYLKYPMGPFSKYFEGVVEELEKEGYLEIKKQKKQPHHEHDTNTYIFKKEYKYKFSDKEKKMLDRIIKLYGGYTGKDLEKISHTQAPWLAVDLYEDIPYELSYYRETPNLVD